MSYRDRPIDPIDARRAHLDREPAEGPSRPAKAAAALVGAAAAVLGAASYFVRPLRRR